VPVEVKKEPSGNISIKTKDGSDAQPVFVVDGKVVKEIDNLDPETIESVSVFKDSDSEVVKKYNAKDGVVVITTKEAAKLLSPKEAKKEVDESILSTEGDVFYVVEDMPSFPGDLPALKTYIYSNLEYPEQAKTQGIEGFVIVRFLINEKGEAVNAEVLRSSYKGFEAPALKVINEMPDWNPGKQRGKPVKVWYVMSIKFDGNTT
jgi:TonB family protein